jgi:hypothetical protein
MQRNKALSQQRKESERLMKATMLEESALERLQTTMNQ